LNFLRSSIGRWFILSSPTTNKKLDGFIELEFLLFVHRNK
jgi:hypothetical protein